MSLAVSVGVLADPHPDPEGLEWLRASLQQVNQVLAAHGLPPHDEPESLPELRDRSQLLGFPYSWLHDLRRAVAFARQAPDEFCPVPAGANPADDDRIDTELFVMMDSHLICHSDCEGYYVPIDFPEPLFDDRLQGGILGSGPRALQEVCEAAPLLGIPLVDGSLSDEAARQIAEEADGSNPYWIERKVWLTLFEAFRQSVEYRCAVHFG
jgi:hypothetical protein